MPRDRLPFRLVLILGLVTACVFHAPGAIDVRDAQGAAALGNGTFAARALATAAGLVRLVYAPTGIFTALHLAAGVLLALAAALSARIAFRAADETAGSGMAAGLFVGIALLFGASTGRLGLDAGPLSLLLALLAGAVWCCTGPEPRAWLGGLLLGAAVAAHPFVLFFVPAFVVMARGSLRDGRPGRAALGFVIGLALLHLPPPGGSFGGALGAWWASGSWTFAPPGTWGEALAELGGALWRNAGPLGILAAAGGLVALRAGHGRSARPFVLAFTVPAAALVVGDTADVPLATALVAWAFLFWTAPAAAALGRRVGPLVLPGAGALAGAYLLAANHAALDHSAVARADWALDSFHRVPEGALFLTQNPVHPALAADGVRPDVETVLVKGMSPAAMRGLLERAGDRPLLMDASLYFDTRVRDEVLGDTWKTSPHGLAFRVRRTSEPPDKPLRNQWDGIDPDVASGRAPLRDGLTVRQFYGRSILQSGFAHLQEGYPEYAEQEFLMALSLPETNRSLAAMGLARTLIARENSDAAIQTLAQNIRPGDAGTRNALDLLHTAIVRAARETEGVELLQGILERTPANQSEVRAQINRLIENLRDRAAQLRRR